MPETTADANDAPAAPPTSALGPTGQLLYSTLFWPYLMSTVALLFVPSLGITVLGWPFDKRRSFLAKFTAVWAGHYLTRAPLAGAILRGREKVREDRPAVYVSNHQSMVDILAIFATHIPMLWVSKVENSYVPFLGWNMMLNRHIFVKRGYMPSIMRMVRLCLRRLEEGYSLFIFPEGTRSPDGQLLPFYSGAFRIARRAGVPIVPIVVEGTSEILPKGSFRIRPRPVQISILDEVHPADFDGDAKRLQEHVRQLMGRELRRLRGEE
jgi:1-acyl-sn-glycerol-3-phosphate acyltransferase